MRRGAFDLQKVWYPKLKRNRADNVKSLFSLFFSSFPCYDKKDYDNKKWNE